jgi:hypothetical protein
MKAGQMVVTVQVITVVTVMHAKAQAGVEAVDSVNELPVSVAVGDAGNP